MKIAVVYLFHVAEPRPCIERFLSSYKAHSTDFPHDLIIACKGVCGGTARSYCAYHGLTPVTVAVPSWGMDLFSYRRVMEATDYDHYLFLNSHSVIEKDGWLKILYESVTGTDGGLVGCTGSAESFSARKWWLRPWFPPFPNPHLRTNAFIISRVLMEKIWPRYLVTKWQAYLFESGRRSLTERALKVGVDARMVSEFRLDHSRLLISDNRTREYDAASDAEKARLRKLSWGK